MKAHIATSALFLMLGLSEASAEPVAVQISGIGRASCATWLSSKDNEFEGSAWILGFWSGNNYALSFLNQGGSVGSSTDAQGIIGEMKKRCMSNPSGIVAAEAGIMFRDFKDMGR